MARKEPSSFLIINPFGIGDVLFSTPVIRCLRERFPAARIHYLCNRRNALLLKNHPCVDTIFEFEHADFEREKQRSFWHGIRKYGSFIRQIRRARIDCAIDFSLCSQFGFFSLAAGIRRRIGLNYKNRGRFLTERVDIDGFSSKHVADYYLDIMPLLGITPPAGRRLEVYADPESIAWADDFCRRNIPAGKPVIGIAPCGGEAFGKDAAVKRWPQDKFSGLINRLFAELDAEIFIFAGPKEKTEVAAVMEQVKEKGRCHEFTDTPLDRIVALVRHCSVFIGNDTGPLRFADASGVKLVAIFGPVDEKVYGPYPEGAGSRVVVNPVSCRPCYRKFRLTACDRDRECLTGISVDTVFDAARRLFETP